MTESTMVYSMTSGRTVRDHILVKADPKKLVQTRFKASQDVMRPYHDRWRRIRNAYHGYVKKRAEKAGRANFHLHVMFQQIEMEAARFIVNYFRHTPFIAVDPASEQDVDAAYKHEITLQAFNERSPSFFLEKLRLIKYATLYGAAFELPSWRRQLAKVRRPTPIIIAGQQIGQSMQETEEVVYEGFWTTTFSPTEVYPYPFARNIYTAPWVIVIEFVHVDELVKRADQGIYDKSAVMKIPLNGYFQDEWELRRQFADLGLVEPEIDSELVCLMHMFSPDRFITLANDDQVIRDVPNIFYHHQVPLVQGVKVIDPDSFWPIGTGQVILPNQRIRNLLNNANIDVVLKNLWPVWKYRPTVNRNELLSLPNQAIQVSQMDDVDVIRMPEMKSDILNLMAMLDANREDVTGYFGVQKGFSTEQHTATSDAIFQSEGNIRIQYDLETFEQLALIPEAKMLSSILLQFMPDDVSVRMAGAAGPAFSRVSKDEIKGQFEFSTSGATEAMNRAVMQKQLLEFFQLVQGSDQFIKLPTGQIIPVPLLDAYNGAKQILEGYNQKGIDKWLYRPELYGIPLNNEMLNQFGMPSLPGLDQLQPNPQTGGLQNRQTAERIQQLHQQSRTVSPRQMVTNANRVTGVAAI